jgi:hypothetical protein
MAKDTKRRLNNKKQKRAGTDVGIKYKKRKGTQQEWSDKVKLALND